VKVHFVGLIYSGIKIHIEGHIKCLLPCWQERAVAVCICFRVTFPEPPFWCYPPKSFLYTTYFSDQVFYTFLISSLHAVCSIHLIIPGLITLIVFRKTTYNLWSSSSCSFLHSPVTSSLGYPCSQCFVLGHLLSIFFPRGEIKFHICTNSN
jgi:hypothetical protein